MPDYISRETWAVIVTVLLTVISTVFIGLRLVVRFFMVRNPGKDDLFCFIAGVSRALFPIMLWSNSILTSLSYSTPWKR